MFARFCRYSWLPLWKVKDLCRSTYLSRLVTVATTSAFSGGDQLARSHLLDALLGFVVNVLDIPDLRAHSCHPSHPSRGLLLYLPVVTPRSNSILPACSRSNPFKSYKTDQGRFLKRDGSIWKFRRKSHGTSKHPGLSSFLTFPPIKMATFLGQSPAQCSIPPQGIAPKGLTLLPTHLAVVKWPEIALYQQI